MSDYSTYFGPDNRYYIGPVDADKGKVQWMLLDTQQHDNEGMPVVIAQCDSPREALATLCK